MAEWISSAIFGITLVLMLIGLFGLIVPIFPGLAVMWLSALGFGWVKGFGTLGIWMFALITLLAIVGSLVDNLFTTVGSRQGGAGWSSIIMGAVAGVVGTVMFPPVGGLILAPLVIFLLEWRRHNNWHKALQSIRGLAVGWGMAFVARFGIGVVMIIFWLIWEWKG
jgi:uncharacterized protein YqgC (DUF456 family)